MIVVETREATNDELQSMLAHMSGEGCGCDDCQGDCGSKHEKEGGCGCGCGHCH